MRKSAKTQETRGNIARVQSYHQGGSWIDEEAYTFAGFESNKCFTSDRFIPLTAEHKRADGKPFKGIGIEVENVCESITDNTVLANVWKHIIMREFPDDLWKMQSDSSLEGESSVECITQIMTKEFIRNQYPAFKKMFDSYFPAFGITAADDSCGMHVNISNAWFGGTDAIVEESVRKLLYFINHHFDFCCDLFKRGRGNTYYCSRMTAYTRKESAQGADLHNFVSSHGVCLNLGHFDAGRVEIRLVGGQSKFAAFRNTMETVFFLIPALKSLSWAQLDDLGRVFQGCNQYVLSRLMDCTRAGSLTAEDYNRIQATVKREEYI